MTTYLASLFSRPDDFLEIIDFFVKDFLEFIDKLMY